MLQQMIRATQKDGVKGNGGSSEDCAGLPLCCSCTVLS